MSRHTVRRDLWNAGGYVAVAKMREDIPSVFNQRPPLRASFMVA
jgi:hypothetical protein